MTTREQQAEGNGRRDQLARLVELLGTYSSTVLISRQLEKVTGGELTPAQLEALAFINRHGGCSAKALSEGLHISIPSSTRLVDRLVRKRLVDRRESGEDRRLVHLTVTETGQTALRMVQEARIDQLQQALATFPPAERQTLARVAGTFAARRAARRADGRRLLPALRHGTRPGLRGERSAPGPARPPHRASMTKEEG